MKIMAIFLGLTISNICNAELIAECHGAADWDGSPAIAQIYGNDEPAKIIIVTEDTIESPTKIDFIDNQKLRIFDNKFAMDFEISPDSVTSASAFRDGMFFVSDFSCTLVKRKQ